MCFNITTNIFMKMICLVTKETNCWCAAEFIYISTKLIFKYKIIMRNSSLLNTPMNDAQIFNTSQTQTATNYNQSWTS